MDEGHERSHRLLDQPEFNILIFAFLLNYPWEFLQAPFFAGLASAPHWDAIRVCTRATIGDAIIMLIAYGSVAGFWRDRWWPLHSRTRQLIAFIGVDLVITFGLESLATRSNHPLWGCKYAEMMPVVPGLHVGLTPLLQWTILPPLVVWFVRRQLEVRPPH